MELDSDRVRAHASDGSSGPEKCIGALMARDLPVPG